MSGDFLYFVKLVVNCTEILSREVLSEEDGFLKIAAMKSYLCGTLTSELEKEKLKNASWYVEKVKNDKGEKGGNKQSKKGT